MRDFTLAAYGRLIDAVSCRYAVIRVDEYLSATQLSDRIAMLRHDVDRRIIATVRCAELLANRGIRGTFYFRYPYTFDTAVILAVARLGHEIGFHYETVAKTRGDVPAALTMFRRELSQFRQVCEVRTVCMHGSPTSPWDNRAIWALATPADFGLVGEPYLSIDFSRVAYLTDTGRSWNGSRYSVRDRVAGQQPAIGSSTDDVIRAISDGTTGDSLMLTMHPERWNDGMIAWSWQLLFQSVKNVAKLALVRRPRE
jgi:hypothetical protein